VDNNGGAEFAETLAKKFYPDHWRTVEMTEGAFRSFAIEYGPTLSVLGPKSGSQPFPFLSLICGLATSVRVGDDLFRFVNSQNREAFFGGFHVEPGAEDSASVIAQLLIPLEPISWQNAPTVQWASRMINDLIGRAAQVAPAVVAQFGGHHFPNGFAEILWMMS
jgi:hypothetical protein